MKGFGILTPKGQAVNRSRRHEKNDSHRNQSKRRDVNNLRTLRQLIEGLGEHDSELETEHGLCPRQQNAGFCQHLLDAAMKWGSLFAVGGHEVLRPFHQLLYAEPE